MVVAVRLRREGTAWLGRVAGVALHRPIGAAGGGELVRVGVTKGGWVERVVGVPTLVKHAPPEFRPLSQEQARRVGVGVVGGRTEKVATHLDKVSGASAALRLLRPWAGPEHWVGASDADVPLRGRRGLREGVDDGAAKGTGLPGSGQRHSHLSDGRPPFRGRPHLAGQLPQNAL